MGEETALNLRTQLDQYAEILVKIGVNVQPGQQLIIGAGPEALTTPVESAHFVATLAEKAYAAGASNVQVIWRDPAIARLNMQHASIEQLASYPSWKADSFMQLVEQDAAFLVLYAPDPHLYRDIDPERVNIASKAEAKAIHPFMQAIQGSARVYARDHDPRARPPGGTFSVTWTVGAVATGVWAGLLFPDLPPDESIERTWEFICRATRADVEDPVTPWQEHLDQLGRRESYLNQARVRRLHYRAPGTDLAVDLIPGSRWMSCANIRSKSGVSFVPNIPSDEVFTSPLRTGVNGTVRSTLPLNYNGVLIENIVLRFERRKVVEASANTGLDILTGLLETDANSRYLGEIALVPADAPLARMHTIFYNTLFDENASCHLALGSGFAGTIEGGAALTEEDLRTRGVNQSAAHVDFMIGSDELDIDGETESGEIVPVLRRGIWATAAA
jgi:aminopeptidase